MKVFSLVPVKKLVETKERLSAILNAEERREFVLAMLLDVLKTVSSSRIDRTVLIGSDMDVRRLSSNFAAEFLSDTGEQLNRVLEYATQWSIRKGAEAVLVLPADIPLVKSADIDRMISLCTHRPSVAISPSHGGGTNALVRNPPDVIPTSFGPESFRKHLNEASKVGIEARIYESPRLSVDIDLPRDLESLLEFGEGTVSHRVLKRLDVDKRLR
jgi:2-phospho-L-lactate guanylyltransferase